MSIVNQVADFHRKVLQTVVTTLNCRMGYSSLDLHPHAKGSLIIGDPGVFYRDEIKAYESSYSDVWLEDRGSIFIFQDMDTKFNAYAFGSIPLIAPGPAVMQAREILNKLKAEMGTSWVIPDDVFCEADEYYICEFGDQVFMYDLDYGYTSYPND